MKAEKLTVLSHTWSITGTIPSPSQVHPNYGQNVHIGVEAPSMEDALAAARVLYPNMTIFNAHHRGEVHIRALA